MKEREGLTKVEDESQELSQNSQLQTMEGKTPNFKK